MIRRPKQVTATCAQEFYPLPAIDFHILQNHSEFVLLESNKQFQQNCYSYLFTEPVRIIKTNDRTEIPGLLREIDAEVARRYVAGFLSYEAGAAWHASLPPGKQESCPLLWLAIFESAMVWDHHLGEVVSGDERYFCQKQSAEGFQITGLAMQLDEQDYLSRIAKIKDYIRSGDTYQVNLTTKYKFRFGGSPYSFYQDLKNKQAVSYNAFLKFDSNYVISISPELFFRKSGRHLTTRPMKGTLARGRTLQEDKARQATLAADAKNRSENVMIVDLMRNDLGRVSRIGSVDVTSLYEVERYDTLLQMTSTVESELRDEINYADIFASLFPCGSVTGAPKLRTMEIIAELEDEPRGVYTGAIGFIAPTGEACFNVPIRTVFLSGNDGEMGVGSGVLYDSDAEAEFAECKLKAQFLIKRFQPFALIESMLFSRGEYRRLKRHLQRLRDSADYFSFKLNLDDIEAALMHEASSLPHDSSFKLRLELRKDGSFNITPEQISPQNTIVQPRVIISEKRTDSTDPFLFHKTTSRVLYEQEFRRCRARGFFDVVFLNELEQVTEGAISNIFIDKNGVFYTPPVSCGLLNGVFRQQFLEAHSDAEERILTVPDLRAADAIFLTNSVRELTKVSLQL